LHTIKARTPKFEIEKERASRIFNSSQKRG
jgi:hypothetical protein